MSLPKCKLNEYTWVGEYEMWTDVGRGFRCLFICMMVSFGVGWERHGCHQRLFMITSKNHLIYVPVIRDTNFIFISKQNELWPPVGKNQHCPRAWCDDDKDLETVKSDTLKAPSKITLVWWWHVSGWNWKVGLQPQKQVVGIYFTFQK